MFAPTCLSSHAAVSAATAVRPLNTQVNGLMRVRELAVAWQMPLSGNGMPSHGPGPRPSVEGSVGVGPGDAGLVVPGAGAGDVGLVVAGGDAEGPGGLGAACAAPALASRTASSAAAARQSSLRWRLRAIAVLLEGADLRRQAGAVVVNGSASRSRQRHDRGLGHAADKLPIVALPVRVTVLTPQVSRTGRRRWSRTARCRRRPP